MEKKAVFKYEDKEFETMVQFKNWFITKYGWLEWEETITKWANKFK